MNESRLSWWVRLLAGVAGAVLLVCCLGLALGHLRDLSHVYHLAGIWLTLADSLRHGVLYPPVEDHGFYAGTRYMPLFFVLIAALERLAGSYLVAAKLAALLSMGLLLAGLFVAVRRITGRLLDAIGLTAMLLAFPEGLSALLSPHADALSVALTLWGLLLLDHPTVSVKRVAPAAFLFALAVAAKFSAVAGPAVGAVVLWQKGQKRLAFLLVGLFALLVAVEVLVIQWGSDGRFVEQFRLLGGGGMSAANLLNGPARFGHALVRTRPFSPFLVVWPAALVLMVLRGRGRPISIWEWYFLAALAVSLVIFSSPGASYNHLLEFQIACLLLLAAAEGAAQALPGLRLLALAVILCGLLTLTGPKDESAISPRELADAFPNPEGLLSDDATVPILLGQRPVVMDAFAYRVLVAQGAIDDAPLVERIRRQEFDALVLLSRLEDKDGITRRFHFGPAVINAMLRAYQFDHEVGRYQVYRPIRSAFARNARRLP
jgi:hypothetical protein